MKPNHYATTYSDLGQDRPVGSTEFPQKPVKYKLLRKVGGTIRSDLVQDGIGGFVVIKFHFTGPTLTCFAGSLKQQPFTHTRLKPSGWS